MKTADLIPFILLELKENDKYGFELTKSIETKSNGQIVIKQPTLYTVLKKLEKSKFISSYWEDSEIGGKRHYYKITENGIKQTLTLPSYNELLKSACADNEIEYPESIPSVQEEKKENENGFSIFDHLQPQTSVLPTEEVFAENSLDSATEMEINQNNIEVLKQESAADEKFANNKEVSKFTESVSTEIPKEIVKEDSVVNFDLGTSTPTPVAVNFENVEYVDYIDFKKDENYVYARKTSKKFTARVLLSCSYLFIMLILCTVLSTFTTANQIYYIFEIISVFVLIFVPTIYASKYKNLKEKLKKKKLEFKFKKYFILSLIIEFLILMACMISNIMLGNNSISNIFNFNNFPNIYAPLLFASTLIFDSIVAKLLLKNK